MSRHIISEMERKRWEEQGREEQSVNRQQEIKEKEKRR